MQPIVILTIAMEEGISQIRVIRLFVTFSLSTRTKAELLEGRIVLKADYRKVGSY